VIGWAGDWHAVDMKEGRGQRSEAVRFEGTQQRIYVAQPLVAAQVIADGDAERLASQFFGDGEVIGLRGRLGINPLREGGGIAHPGAAIALRGGRHIAVEPRHARDDDFVAIGIEDQVTKPAAKRLEHGMEGAGGHGRARSRAEL
jgi:hypothetical protein